MLIHPEVPHVKERLWRLLPAHHSRPRGGGVDLVELVARGDVVVGLLDQGRRRRAGTEDALAADVVQGEVGQDESGKREIISKTKSHFEMRPVLGRLEILSHLMSHGWPRSIQRKSCAKIISNESLVLFSPKEEQYGPLVLKEAGYDTEGDDPGQNGEEQEGERDHDEEQGVR